MASRCNCILAVMADLFVLAVGFRSIPIRTFTTAGAFQNIGQNIRMGRIVDLLTSISIDFAFLLGEIPIFPRNNSLMLTFVHGEL